MDYEILSYISQGLFWIIEILILIACIILVIKDKSTPFILMLVGIIMSMLFGAMSTFVYTLQLPVFGIEQIFIVSSIVTIFQAIGYSLFGLGLFIFARNYLKIPIK